MQSELLLPSFIEKRTSEPEVSMKQYMRYILRAVLVMLNNLYCIPTYVIWTIFFHPVRIVSERTFWAIEGRFFYWLLTMVAYWSYSAGYDIYESGDDINDIVTEETLVLVNHQSTSDVPLLMAAFSTRFNLLPNLTWIMDGIFKYTNFGIVSILHGDFFIAAGRDKRNATLAKLREFIKKVYIPRERKWIVLFPEGGFLRKRREISKRYAAKNNYPDLEHVTLPRMGAVQAIMDSIGPKPPEDCDPANSVPNNNVECRPGQIKYIIDMTIAYPKGEPLDLGAIVCGYVPPCEIQFNYRIYPIGDVPTETEEKLQEWLYARYIEKESMLAKHYSDTEFEPAFAVSPRRVDQDLLRIFLIHVFFILSTSLHAWLIYAFCQYILSRIF